MHVSQMPRHRSPWRKTTQRRHRPRVATVAAIGTAILVAVALAAVVALNSLPRLVAGVLSNDAVSLGAGVVVGVALLVVAVYVTIWWPALDVGQRTALTLLALLLWTLGMLLGDARLAEHRVQVARWLVSASPPSLPGLALVVTILVLLTTVCVTRWRGHARWR
jgi:hypothetical protein